MSYHFHYLCGAVKQAYHRLVVSLAWWTVRLVSGSAEPGVDYTSRCPGCGYYAGEKEAAGEHFPYGCGHSECAWWEPLSGWWWGTGLVGWLRQRWYAWKYPMPGVKTWSKKERL